MSSKVFSWSYVNHHINIRGDLVGILLKQRALLRPYNLRWAPIFIVQNEL